MKKSENLTIIEKTNSEKSKNGLMTIKEEKCIIYIYKLTQILQQSTSATDSV